MEVAGVLPDVPEKFSRGPKGPRASKSSAGSAREEGSPADGTDLPPLANEDEDFQINASGGMGASVPEIDPTA